MRMDEIYEMYMKDVYRFLLWMTKEKDLGEELLEERFMGGYIDIDW